MNDNDTTDDGVFSRRKFLGNSLATTAIGSLLGVLPGKAQAEEEAAAPPKFDRKIKLGVVGLGMRGFWISKLFAAHGGYDIHAVADYFPEVVEKNGDALGVAKDKQFSGLSGYQKVIESGVEAIIILDVPYFYPEQVKAATDAGLHIYMAKPIAVDVPGVLSVQESAKRTTEAKRAFLVDYQIPTDEFNSEVTKRVQAGALGPIQTLFSIGQAGTGGFSDPPLTDTIASRLRGLIWTNDDALGGGYIGNYDIHIVEAVLRTLGKLPTTATGWGGQFRKRVNGDTLDTNCIMYGFEDGVVWNHQSVVGRLEIWFSGQGPLTAEIQGKEASARLAYHSKVFIRGGKQHYGARKIKGLYKAGAVANIATFYENITKEQFANETVKDAVDSALVCFLGREAAATRTQVTMEQLLKQNKKLEVDLKGLKA